MWKIILKLVFLDIAEQSCNKKIIEFPEISFYMERRSFIENVANESRLYLKELSEAVKTFSVWKLSST